MSRDPILETRFHPPGPPSCLVVRSRLLDRLSAAVREHPVTLISAPAGTGKSELAAEWLRSGRPPWPVVWLALEPSDDQPGVFWRYVVEGLRRAGATVSKVGLPGLAESVDRAFVARLACEVLELPEPVVLVLDGVDGVIGEQIADGLDFLVRHVGSRFRLVLVGRSDPLLPLHRYRLSGAIGEIRLADLAFTPTEVAELLSAHALSVSPGDAAALADRTEGWAAGLALAAMSLERGVEPGALIASLGHGAIAEYLLAEVLDTQPPDLRQVLLRLSVPDILTAELCDLLSERSDGVVLLPDLARRNAFLLEVVDRPGYYRLHPLFREVLRLKLAYEDPDQVAGLHRRYADWCAATGATDVAVEHAMAAGAAQDAARIVVDGLAISRLLVAPDSGRYAAVLARFPADLEGAAACVVRAALALAADDVDACAAELTEAARSTEDTEPDGPLRLALALVAAVLSGVRGEAGTAVSEADRAALVEGHLLDGPERPLLRALIAQVRASGQLWLGDETRAGKSLLSAAHAADRAGCSSLRLECLSQLALLDAARGRFDSALELGRTAVRLADESGVPRDQRPAGACLGLAWACIEQYELAAARRWLLRAEESAGAPRNRLLLPLVAALRARLVPGRTTGVDQQPAGAALRAPWLVGRVEAGDGLEARVRAALVLVRRHLEAGDQVAAGRELSTALQLAAPERLRRPFLEAPPSVRALVRADAGPATSWLDPTRSAPRRSSVPVQRLGADEPVLVERLTARETEVLRHLSELLTTEEIAAAMFVSVNTVRTHIRSVLRKLASSRRNDAIRRARDLQLL